MRLLYLLVLQERCRSNGGEQARAIDKAMPMSSLFACPCTFLDAVHRHLPGYMEDQHKLFVPHFVASGLTSGLWQLSLSLSKYIVTSVSAWYRSRCFVSMAVTPSTTLFKPSSTLSAKSDKVLVTNSASHNVAEDNSFQVNGNIANVVNYYR